MKRLIVLAACVGATAMAFGQGQFNLNNRVTAAQIDARVTDSAGNPVSGADGFVVQAYLSTSEDGSYAPVGNILQFRDAPAAGLGYIKGSIQTAAGSAVSSAAWIKLAAWSTNDGATYEAAEAAFGAIGMSNPVNVTLGGDTVQPPDLVGLQAWSVDVIPEPSTFALGLIGIGALMLRRRK